MASYKYTGRTSVLEYKGKRYAQPDIYKKNPKDYDGSFDKAIPNMTKEDAENLVSNSNLHSFEVDGEDLLEKMTGA